MKHSFATASVLTFPAALLLFASADAAQNVPRSRLVTPTSIGPARLGMSVRALKGAFPGSSIEFLEGPVSEHALRQKGREILRFNTREERLSLPFSDSHTVTALRTCDPRFKTAAGVGAGFWLKDAATIYGRPTLSFWSHGEEATFPQISKKIMFSVSAPPNPKSVYRVAGIYSKRQLEALEGTTKRYRAGTKITFVGCSR